MTALTWFGLFAISAMVFFYAYERRGHVYILGFAFACALASVYGFLQGAWQLGVVGVIWAAVALHRWRIAVSTYER